MSTKVDSNGFSVPMFPHDDGEVCPVDGKTATRANKTERTSSASGVSDENFVTHDSGFVGRHIDSEFRERLENLKPGGKLSVRFMEAGGVGAKVGTEVQGEVARKEDGSYEVTVGGKLLAAASEGEVKAGAQARVSAGVSASFHFDTAAGAEGAISAMAQKVVGDYTVVAKAFTDGDVDARVAALPARMTSMSVAVEGRATAFGEVPALAHLVSAEGEASVSGEQSLKFDFERNEIIRERKVQVGAEGGLGFGETKELGEAAFTPLSETQKVAGLHAEVVVRETIKVDDIKAAYERLKSEGPRALDGLHAKTEIIQEGSGNLLGHTVSFERTIDPSTIRSFSDFTKLYDPTTFDGKWEVGAPETMFTSRAYTHFFDYEAQYRVEDPPRHTIEGNVSELLQGIQGKKEEEHQAHNQILNGRFLAR